MASYYPVKKLGSSKYYRSEDGQRFMKCHPKEKLLRKEYQNLQRARRLIRSVSFVAPIECTKGCLVTEYVDAQSLLERLKEREFAAFGKALRKMHEEGHTHGHLQFNDVLVTTRGFVLTDLTTLDEKEPLQDLLLPMLGVEAFKLKRPWKWRRFARCQESFLRGYRFHDKEKLKRSYEEALVARIHNLKNQGGVAALKGQALGILNRR